MEPLDCTGCTECCNWLTFIVQPEPKTFKLNTEFWEKRGCKLTMLQAALAVTIPSKCPHLTADGCGCYEERPLLCRQYDCRRDPFLKGGKYNAERKEK